LSLGIGANTAIFSAVNAVILQPLPFAAPNRLMMLWEENPEKGWHQQVVAPANMLDWREQVPAFQDVTGYAEFGRGTLTGDGASPQLLRVTRVMGNFFSVLGVRPEVGRVFNDEETWGPSASIAVVSHRLWRDRFGSDRALVGRTIQLAGRSVQVVGVMPSSFSFPAPEMDVWMPWGWERSARSEVSFRRAHYMRAIARLKPEVSREEAAAQLQQVVRRLQREYPATNRVMGAGMTPLHEFLVGETRLPLLVLLGAVALLLLIACANVGNLLLVQAAGRAREVSLRLALGAGRARLARQALTESLVLSVLGGLGGLALGWWGTRATVALQPEHMLRVKEFGMDLRVLAYVLIVTTVSGLLFGMAPALWSMRRAPAEALKSGGRSGGGSDGRRIRQWGDHLVVAEVAIALLLTVGAGLLVRSFWSLRRVDPGFDGTGVLAVSIDLPESRYDTGDKMQGFFDDLARRVRALPGVSETALTSNVSLATSGYTSDFVVAGRAPGEYGTEVIHRVVSPEYFRAMRVPLVRGRAFAETDRATSPPVLIINEALARSYFPGQDPVGQRMTFDKVPDSTSVWATIVGVVRSEHQTSLAKDPQIEAFIPFAQEQSSGMTLLVRLVCGANVATCDASTVAPAVRRLVSESDPNLALASVKTLTNVLASSLARERFLMTLLLVFAVVGLLLAVIGVYGVLAQLARRRVREMGIRIALGAQGSQVRWLVVKHGLKLTGLGLALGGAAALLSTRAMQGLLFGIPASDPLTFVAVALVLSATSALATWLPAVKASRADPAIALRGE
jgi:putative ABC transport system permease protein